MNQPGPQQGNALKKKHSTRAILVALALVLALFAIYYVWHWRHYSKPHCADYKGMTGAACAQLAKACGPDKACLNAVAHCIPILARADPNKPHRAGGAAGGLVNYVEQAELNACTHAIARIDPAFAAHLLSGYVPCVSTKYAAPFQKEADYRAMVDAARAAEPLLPWAVQVAKAMPVCASPVTPVTPYAPVTPVTPPYAPVTPPYAPVTPPYAPVTPPYAPVTPPYAPVTPPYAPVTPSWAPLIPNVAPLLAPLAPFLSPLSPGAR